MFLPPGGLFVHQKERSLNHLRIQRISLPFWPSSKSNLTQFVDIDRLNEQWPFFLFQSSSWLAFSSLSRSNIYENAKNPFVHFENSKPQASPEFRPVYKAGLNSPQLWSLISVCFQSNRVFTQHFLRKTEKLFNSQYRDASLPLRNI